MSSKKNTVKKPLFPERIFVQAEAYDDEKSFFVAEDLDGIEEPNELVAVYELVETKKLVRQLV